MIRSELLEYRDEETVCEAYVAWPAAGRNPPCVMVAHDWSGRLPHIDRRADDLAAQGYLAVAIDIYGRGNRGEATGDNSGLMNPFLADRALLLRRLRAALTAVTSLPNADPERVAIVGYCFGGLCALDLARSGDPRLRAAISIHGLLSKPPETTGAISASVLVLHGWSDPLATPPAVIELAAELTQAQADWQLHAFGHAVHAFTAEAMNDLANGLAHDPKAAARSRQSELAFLSEVLA